MSKELIVKGDGYNIYSLLSSGKRIFVIPPFQRNYDWNTKTCLTLIDDLMKNVNSKYSYYINQIVYKIDDIDDIYQEYMIIDGQQRLTTIFLILASIRNNIKNEGVVTTINEELLLNSIKSPKVSLKSKMQQISDDKDVFEKIIANKIDEISNKNSNMFIQFINIDKEIKKLDEKDMSNLYKEIKEAIYTRIEINSMADSQLIQKVFEKMNSAGQELKGSDLIRNYLLMPFPNAKQQELYNDYWKIIEIHTQNDIEEFFRIYIMSQTGQNVKDNYKQIYLDFIKYFDSFLRKDDSDKLLNEINKIKLYSMYYDTMVNSNTGNEEIDEYLLRINKLNIKAVYPFYLLMLAKYNANEIDEKVIIEIFYIIENYIARRSLIPEYNTKNYNKFFCSLYYRIHKAYKSFNSEILKYYLLTIEQTGKYPNDAEVVNGILEKNVYLKGKENYLAQFLLERINHGYSVEESHSTRDIYNKFNFYTDKDETGISIEHIMPEGNNDERITSKEWREYLGENCNDIFKKWVHKLANLTITAFNSGIGDNLYIEKEKKSKKDFYLESAFPINNKYFVSVNDWKEEQIIERNNNLTDIVLTKIWPHIKTEYKPKTNQISLADIFLGNFNPENLIKSFEITVRFGDDKLVENIKIDTAKEFLIMIFRYVYEHYNNEIDSLIVKNEFSELTSTEKETKSARSIMITDGVYIDVNTSTEKKFAFLCDLFDKLELDMELLTFEFEKQKYEYFINK